MPSPQTPDVATLPIPEKEGYTYADYAELPESAPYELIAGSLVIASSLTSHHQRVLRRLAWAIQRHHDQLASPSGESLFAPMDVFLAEDTTVQPDLVYIAPAQREIVGEQRIEGAPDLIAEILSLSTVHRDVGVKKRLYEQHSVREYWTLDPASQAVEVHVNTDAGFTQHVRVVEAGAVASTGINGFEVDVADLL